MSSDFAQEVLKILETRIVTNRREIEDHIKRYIQNIRIASTVSRYQLDEYLRTLGDSILKLQQDFSSRDSIAYAKEIARRVKQQNEEIFKEHSAISDQFKEQSKQIKELTEKIAQYEAELKEKSTLTEGYQKTISSFQNQIAALHKENQSISDKLKRKTEDARKYASELEETIKTNIQIAQDIQKRDAAIEGLKNRMEEIEVQHKQEIARLKQEWDLKLANAVVQAKSGASMQITPEEDTSTKTESDTGIKKEEAKENREESKDEYSKFQKEISDFIATGSENSGQESDEK
ncbi:MAG: hypothetical protein ACTSRU_11695 [Candidatus Hodarchaeales archaeon]